MCICSPNICFKYSSVIIIAQLNCDEVKYPIEIFPMSIIWKKYSVQIFHSNILNVNNLEEMFMDKDFWH